MSLVNIKIEGQPYQVEAGLTILEAAKACGYEIPSLCALGQTASNPVNSTLAHFRDEYLAHIVDKKCPAHVCKNLMQYTIDADKCIGCGMCAKGCPASCITRTDYVAEGHKLASMASDADKCVKCGACISTCKFNAISKV